jgi:hypothetical protein
VIAGQLGVDLVEPACSTCNAVSAMLSSPTEAFAATHVVSQRPTYGSWRKQAKAGGECIGELLALDRKTRVNCYWRKHFPRNLPVDATVMRKFTSLPMGIERRRKMTAGNARCAESLA